MKNATAVNRHYHRPGLGENLLESLAKAGFRPGESSFQEMPALDEMHLRGRQATVELAGLGTLAAELRVLDAGSGLGGSARFLAAVYGCAVTGVDLTQELCRSARLVSEALGLGSRTRFVRATATELPVTGASFDVVWTQYAQMNIAAKEAFYSELVRALSPGGQLLFHDVFARNLDGFEFPVPWAESPEISFLEPAERVSGWLTRLGLRRVEWRDRTDESTAWAAALAGEATEPGQGSSLVMTAAQTKIANLLRNLEAGRLQVVMARYEKPAAPRAERSIATERSAGEAPQ